MLVALLLHLVPGRALLQHLVPRIEEHRVHTCTLSRRRADRRVLLAPAQRQEQGRVGPTAAAARPAQVDLAPWSAAVARRRRGALQITAASAVAGVALRGDGAVAMCCSSTCESGERWVKDAGLGACGGVVMRTGSGMTGKVC